MRYLSLLPVLMAVVLFAIVINLRIGNAFPVRGQKPMQQIMTVSQENDVVHAPHWTENDVHKLLLMRTKQKQGVYLSRLEPALDSAGLEVVAVYHQVLGDDYIPVITSGNDYAWHARNSKHYQNKAIDFRLIGLSKAQKVQIVAALQRRLPSYYGIIWEMPGASGEHLHVEMNE